MGVAVLSPQDCLPRHPHRHRHLISSPANKPRRTPPNPNTSPNRSSTSTRRKRTSSTGSSPTRSKSPPVMGQIRILKRGEEDLIKQPPQVPARTMSMPIPVPVLPDGFYAGSAFVTSPPPSELPVPAFFTKRNCGLTQNQEIASELRRVLKLI